MRIINPLQGSNGLMMRVTVGNCSLFKRTMKGFLELRPPSSSY